VSFEWLRLVWGSACLLIPARLTAAAGGPVDRRATDVARVLGVRHLVQGAVSVARPTPPVLRAGAAIDLLHSASMVVLGGFDRGRRRLAWTDAVIAASWCLAGLQAGRRAETAASDEQGGNPSGDS
jgi:hypothetical protein